MKTKRADFAAAFLRGWMIVAGGLGEHVINKTNLALQILCCNFVLILPCCCDRVHITAL